MKTFRLLLAALLAAFTFAGAAHAADAKPVRVLLAYGGHGFKTNLFFAMWDAFPGVTYAKCELPKQADLLKPGLEKQFDVIVFYDMVKGITPEQQQAFVALLNTGIGVVATHHTLGAHDGWPEYWKIIGGHYMHKAETIDGQLHGKSSFVEGQELAVKVADPQHPITQGVKDFTIHDEAYGNFYVAPDVHVLLTVEHPKCGRDIAWTKTYGKSRVCYLMFGHDDKGWNNPNYHTLLLNALHWAAEGSAR
jgi:hypothetical protein